MGGGMAFLKRHFGVFYLLQFIVVLAAFGLDFAHGMVLGQHQIGFRPESRLRQALAIAISRMHQPPLSGYLAYQSVIDDLNANGFTLFDDERGLRLDEEARTALLGDPARMDRTLRHARDAMINGDLTPQRINGNITGNEVAYADYFYSAIRLFGLHMSSLYYLYFLLLGTACALFVLQFRNSPFLMFLLTTYLGGIFFLQNYAQTEGSQLATLANSRLFEALSLLPAVHIFVAVWRRMPFKLSTLAIVVAQSAVLVFIVDCRVAARWQIAMIVATALGLLLVEACKSRSLRLSWLRQCRNGIWAAGVVAAFVAGHMGLISVSVDASYKSELKYHAMWDSVLGGLLESSTQLQREYLGGDGYAVPFSDDLIEDAINNDLNKRHDMSSPIASTNSEGKIEINVGDGKDEYDRLAEALSFRIVRQHPLEVLAGFYRKILNQIAVYGADDAITFRNLAGMIILSVAGGLIWLSQGFLAASNEHLSNVAGAGAIVLAFATIPALIVASALSVGTLLSFLIASITALFVILALTAKATGSQFALRPA
jgi:hypothetical protein